MIELLNRYEILSLNKTFASFVIDWQQHQYDPSLEHNKSKVGMMYDIALNKARHYSQEEVNQMNKERLEEYNREKDNVETVSVGEKYTGTVIYNFPYAAIENYVESLAEGMVKLAEKLEWKSVIFLLVYPTPWLEQENDYKPVKKALDYLKSIGITNDFTGGIKANRTDLEELMKHLFWIFRCNASLPYCFFSGIEKDFVGSICKYGNIHFHFYSDAEMIETKNKVLVPQEDGKYILKKQTNENGAIKTTAKLKSTLSGNVLMDALMNDDHLKKFLQIPSKDNGFDIEGLTVNENGYVFIGLRGPVLRGWAIILELHLETDEQDSSILKMKSLNEGDLDNIYRKHFLDLDNLGIRDLCIDGSDMLILAGPTMNLDGPVKLFRWKDGAQKNDESIVWNDDITLKKLIEDIPYGKNQDHAEGITTFSREDGKLSSILIVYDSASKNRQKKPATLLADVFNFDE